jgi:hypothetical protein
MRFIIPASSGKKSLIPRTVLNSGIFHFSPSC